MKSVKVVMIMQYDVEDDKASQRHNNDRQFFESIEKSFWAWQDRAGEDRIPVHFELDIELTDKESKKEDEIHSTESKG